jgi:uncharacterized paraquat-inducible protein A
MTATISVSCPKCKKTIQAPETVKGKKIKCKGCGDVFGVPADAKAKAQSTRADKPKGDDEEWGVVKAYGVTEESDKPRCPFCAWELESEEDVVCLKCGYNLQTRERLQEKVLEPVTGTDYFVWLLPGLICLFFALSFLAGIAILIVLLMGTEPGWIRGGIIYLIVFDGFVVFFTGRFAIKRLILNRHPPEKEKTLKKDEPG